MLVDCLSLTVECSFILFRCFEFFNLTVSLLTLLCIRDLLVKIKIFTAEVGQPLTHFQIILGFVIQSWIVDCEFLSKCMVTYQK